MIGSTLLAGMLVLTGVVSPAPQDPSPLQPCPSAAAADTLELGIWSALTEVLKLDAPPVETGGWLIARFLTRPGWGEDPELAVSIYLPDEGAAIVAYARPEVGITRSAYHQYEVAPNTFESRLLPSLPEIPVQRTRRLLTRSLAEAIQASLVQALAVPDAGPSDRVVLDGTTYYFLTRQHGLGLLCARVASPEPSSPSVALARLGDALSRYALGNATEADVTAALSAAASNPSLRDGQQSTLSATER